MATEPNGDIDKIVRGGYCVGCGACAYQLGTSMRLNAYGEYEPALESQPPQAVKKPDACKACPFLAPEMNEDSLAEPLFASDGKHDERIGYHHAIFGGYVREGDFRAAGTSGGMGTWIGVELMRRGEIDGIIHVKPAQKRESQTDPFFRYAISRSEAQAREGAKTRYHAVEISRVMREVRESEGRYLFVGLPCMCKAVRRLQRLDPVLRERIVCVLSLVCGHLKSVNWTLSLGWGAGIHPSNIEAFQYRTKGPGIPARAYVFTATKKDPPGEGHQQNSAAVVGGKFNAGAMMLNACDYCDDVVGETADITIGDAWLPRYDVDPGGTNLIIARTKKMAGILAAAREEERIHLEPITAKEAGDSQAGGFRHRREGLSYRLAKARKEGRWTPEKRVEPGAFPVSGLRKRIYDMRAKCAAVSREAFRQALDSDDYGIYERRMQPLFKKLRSMEVRSSFLRAAWGRAHRMIRRRYSRSS